jgi:hypothetical protein
MKKWIIGSLVGAVIVFAWQAASWMFLGIHDNQMNYTPAQEQIMSALSSSLNEDGMYFFAYSQTRRIKPGKTRHDETNGRQTLGLDNLW